MTGHPTHASGPAQPGSDGEHLLQRLFGTDRRAADFYGKQVLDHLNSRMQEFIECQEMAFLATADAKGECDCTFRAGPPGFIRVVDDRMLAYPEYRGNGVMASLGNILENRHIGILLVDFFNDLVGLHVNGRARLLTAEEAARHGLTDSGSAPGRRVEHWVAVAVEEAYIHCSKHIPLLAKEDRRSRVADRSVRPAGSDYFTGADAGARGTESKTETEHAEMTDAETEDAETEDAETEDAETEDAETHVGARGEGTRGEGAAPAGPSAWSGVLTR